MPHIGTSGTTASANPNPHLITSSSSSSSAHTTFSKALFRSTRPRKLCNTQLSYQRPQGRGNLALSRPSPLYILPYQLCPSIRSTTSSPFSQLLAALLSRQSLFLPTLPRKKHRSTSAQSLNPTPTLVSANRAEPVKKRTSFLPATYISRHARCATTCFPSKLAYVRTKPKGGALPERRISCSRRERERARRKPIVCVCVCVFSQHKPQSHSCFPPVGD